MKTLLLLAVILVAAGCGGGPDADWEFGEGGLRLTADFQAAKGLTGLAHLSHPVGAWSAASAENTFGGHLTYDRGGGITFWFGAANSSAFQLRTVAHMEGDTLVAGSIDPVVDATVWITR